MCVHQHHLHCAILVLECTTPELEFKGVTILLIVISSITPYTAESVMSDGAAESVLSDGAAESVLSDGAGESVLNDTLQRAY